MSDLAKEPPFDKTVEAICDEIRNYLKPSRGLRHVKITVDWVTGDLPNMFIETDGFLYAHVNGESEDNHE